MLLIMWKCVFVCDRILLSENKWPFLQNPLPHMYTKTHSHMHLRTRGSWSHVLTLTLGNTCADTTLSAEVAENNKLPHVYIHHTFKRFGIFHTDRCCGLTRSILIGWALQLRLGRCYIPFMLTCAVIGYTIMYDTVTQIWVCCCSRDTVSLPLSLAHSR